MALIKLSVKIPPVLDAKLRARAEELDRSISWVVVRALELALEGREMTRGRAAFRGASERALDEAVSAGSSGPNADERLSVQAPSHRASDRNTLAQQRVSKRIYGDKAKGRKG